MNTDNYAFLVTDSAGEIVGSGMTRHLAIEDAADALGIEIGDIEDMIEKTKKGHGNADETFLIRSRLDWEVIAMMTVEEYFCSGDPLN